MNISCYLCDVCTCTYMYVHRYFLTYVPLLICFYCMLLGLSLLQSGYDSILHSLPDNFLGTLDVLQDDLTDECICAVVECSDSQTANKLMLHCLIENYTEDVAGFCDVLERIVNVPSLDVTINNLRKGIFIVIRCSE